MADKISKDEYLTKKMNYYGVPDYMQESLLAYILTGRPVGDFLTALLENDLMEAFAFADDVNQKAMGSYVQFLYNHAPSGCWGSPKAVTHWLKTGGLMEIHHERAL